jgi:trehalose monomycolate/heme transporter
MFEAWGRFVHRRRWLVLALGLAAVTVAAVWGTGVFGSLQSSGGFTPPSSQSRRASDLIARSFGRDSADVVVLYRSARRTADSRPIARR